MKRNQAIFLSVPATVAIIVLVLFSGCRKKPDLATLTTSAVSGITVTTATSGGDITSDGRAEVTARGLCWNTSKSPDITGSHTTDGDGTGSFVSTLSGLTPNTLYYVRAFATNSVGTSYGNEVSFSTSRIVQATITTEVISSITPTTAVGGGSISSDGGGAVTAKGICWSTAANPTTSDSKTSNGTGNDSFTANITGLTPGTLYHVRAYAINTAGTAYGSDITFTSSANTPSLTTTAASGVTTTSAVSGGNISSTGGAAVTARGVCWKTSSNPTVTDSHTTDGNGAGSFTSTITGLQANTRYYVRAYATNSAGTSYGNEITIDTNPVVIPTLTTTAASSITTTSAVSGGNISSDGGASVTAKGVCWSVNANPTTSGSKTSDGTGAGSFTSSLTGLQGGTTYHIRAYATNSAGTAYGNDLTFTTSPVVPVLTTTTASNIAQSTATSGGNISSNGGAAVTARGVCWSTASGPTVAGSHTTDGNGSGSFASSIAGLTANTMYYVRAYATNSVGTAYGNEITFTTIAVSVPVVTTTGVSSVLLTSAASGGNVTSSGGGSVTARGVCWSTSQNPTAGGSHTTDGNGTGSYSSNISGLASGTTYYVRAYATNSAGTGYGSQIEFTSSMADIEGNIYRVVRIGTQIWMAENLRTTKDTDNNDIANVTDNTAWSTLATPAYCWYANNSGYKSTYGALYNWITVNTGKLCPTGWHVPTDDEYKTLEQYLGMAPADLDVWGWRGTDQGSQLKSATGWASGENGSNSSGFSALPGGYRYAADGGFYSLGNLAYWWTASLSSPDIAWYRRLDGPNNNVYRAATSVRGGKFIRCVKN